jgi:hypothetical protein
LEQIRCDLVLCWPSLMNSNSIHFGQFMDFQLYLKATSLEFFL